MSWGEFKIMQKKGVELPIISDIIRLRVLCKSQGDYAWFWDVDTLVLADLSTIGVKLDAFHHVLASMERPRSKAGTTTAAFEEHCICNFLCSPRDKAYPLLVVYPRGPFTSPLVSWMESHVSVSFSLAVTRKNNK